MHTYAARQPARQPGRMQTHFFPTPHTPASLPPPRPFSLGHMSATWVAVWWKRLTARNLILISNVLSWQSVQNSGNRRRRTSAVNERTKDKDGRTLGRKCKITRSLTVMSCGKILKFNSLFNCWPEPDFTCKCWLVVTIGYLAYLYNTRSHFFFSAIITLNFKWISNTEKGWVYDFLARLLMISDFQERVGQEEEEEVKQMVSCCDIFQCWR